MNSLPIEVDVEDSATLEEYLESLYVEETLNNFSRFRL